MKPIKIILFMLMVAIVCSCGMQEQKFDIDVRLGEFGAFYTKLNSGQEFEKYSRTGDYGDIVVDLGTDSSMFVFWRGSSFLPFLQTPNGKWFVDEIIDRKGDGTDMMPDRTNAYSVIKLIESSPEQVVVHWRYLPEFMGGNPQLGVSAEKFVDEYYYIQPDGSVKRTIKKGTKRIDEWKDPHNKMVQTFRLTADGIVDAALTEAKKSKPPSKLNGNPIIEKSVANPVAWWKFVLKEEDDKGYFIGI